MSFWNLFCQVFDTLLNIICRIALILTDTTSKLYHFNAHLGNLLKITVTKKVIMIENKNKDKKTTHLIITVYYTVT